MKLQLCRFAVSPKVLRSAVVLAVVFMGALPLLASITITGISIDYSTAPNQITISGQGLVGNCVNLPPKVVLNNTTLTLLTGFTNQTIVAKLPSGLLPGSYVVSVTTCNGGDTATFTLTYGAVGAPGPMGPCNLFTVTGSYVRQVPTTQYIDQLTLGIDGTAYWNQSSSFDYLLTTGTFIPEIGSWKCLDDGSVLVTTIGTIYFSTIGVDIRIDQNTRLTQKLSVVNNDTLKPTHRIFTYIPLANDPFGPGFVNSCTPSVNPCDPAPYKRVKPRPTDIP